MNLKNILLVLGVGTALIFVYRAGGSVDTAGPPTSAKVENGVQIVDLVAKGGYSPRTIQVQPNLPIKLKVETKNTFDCSSAFQIPSLKIAKSLPANGTTEFDIPALSPGQSLEGNCSMYMYKFTLRASN
jgi:plastocyanin domain-containing protein